jgi:hypothetical protein
MKFEITETNDKDFFKMSDGIFSFELSISGDILFFEYPEYLPSGKIEISLVEKSLDELFIAVKKFAEEKDIKIISMEPYRFDHYYFVEEISIAERFKNHGFEYLRMYAILFNYAKKEAYDQFKKSCFYYLLGESFYSVLMDAHRETESILQETTGKNPSFSYSFEENHITDNSSHFVLWCEGKKIILKINTDEDKITMKVNQDTFYDLPIDKFEKSNFIEMLEKQLETIVNVNRLTELTEPSYQQFYRCISKVTNDQNYQKRILDELKNHYSYPQIEEMMKNSLLNIEVEKLDYGYSVGILQLILLHENFLVIHKKSKEILDIKLFKGDFEESISYFEYKAGMLHQEKIKNELDKIRRTQKFHSNKKILPKKIFI